MIEDLIRHMYEEENLTFGEIASALRISLYEVKKYYYKAIRKTE